jgi:tRNA(fMet)-specific endonuclease VapC
VGRRLILDTNVLIAYERGTVDRSSLDDDELAIASVSVAGYRAGIEMADSHGRLLAQVRRSGSPRGAHDLIIAAHAAETGRTILSRDANVRFGELPGVSAIDA